MDTDYAPIVDVLEEKSKNSKALISHILSVVNKPQLDNMMGELYSYAHE